MKNLLIVLALLTSTFASAQEGFELIEKVEAEDGKVVIPYSKYKLNSNNLTVIIHEDHSDPIVHVEVAYHVGSARESIRNSGFAHFFEHMMFQGSKNVKDEEHFKIISAAGGTNNAYTAFDKTVYHQTAPSNLTETMLWLEADRMGLHLDGFTQKKFENQRDAVKNEKRQRYDNQPYGMVNEELFKSLYANHPYEWTPIGFVDDLDAASFDDLRNFFLRWYGPNNATLVVAGDVNPEEVLPWIKKYFENINECPKVTKMYPKKPQLSEDYYVNMTDNIGAPLTFVAFPTVPEFHKDEAALDILSEVLGGGNNSIIYKNLVKTKEAFQGGSFHQALELSGFLGIQVLTPMTGLSYKDLETKIRKSISEFETRGVADEDLEVIKSQVIRSAYSSFNSIQSKAGRLSHYALMKGDGYNLQNEIDRYSSVTKEDVIRVYNKYIKNKKAIWLRVEREAPKKEDEDRSKSVNPHAGKPKKVQSQYKGLTYNPPKDDFDRSIQPKLAKAQGITIPEFYQTSFDNGLKIIGTQSKEAPIVYFYIDLEGGHLLAANKKVSVGTPSLTASMLGQGTKNLTTEEFTRKLELLGSSISFNSGTRNSSIFVSCLAERVDETMKLLKEAMFEPRFDEEDFTRIKKSAIDALQTQKSSPSVLAAKAWNKLMFEGSILEEYQTGDYKSLSKIKLADVKAYYENYYSPNIATLVISGDISKDEALSKVAFLKDWKNKNVTVPSLPEFKMPSKTTIYLVDKPYAAQSTIYAGHPAMKYDYNGDYFKSSVMNFALGGAFNSRINLNLREDKGYTYGARSRFSANKEYGMFRFSSEIKKEATDSAIAELMKEINNYVENGISEEELSFTKSSMTLSEALDYETPFQKLGFLSSIVDYSLPKNYTTEQAKLVNAMSVADINAMAKSSLHPDQMVILVVGHAYKIKDALNKLGYGNVVELEVD